MIKPLALIYYERLLPGSQLGNRLQDIGYRVQTAADPARLFDQVKELKPIVLIIDLLSKKVDILELIATLKQDSETNHLPIIAFAGQKNQKLQNQAVEAGATIVAIDDAILQQLPELLEQALEVH